MPGCRVADVDRDGEHWCLARVGVVELRAGAGAVAVEITQTEEAGGALVRRVELWALDDAGGYCGDGITVDQASAGTLIALLWQAFDVART